MRENWIAYLNTENIKLNYYIDYILSNLENWMVCGGMSNCEVVELKVCMSVTTVSNKIRTICDIATKRWRTRENEKEK